MCICLIEYVTLGTFFHLFSFPFLILACSALNRSSFLIIIYLFKILYSHVHRHHLIKIEFTRFKSLCFSAHFPSAEKKKEARVNYRKETFISFYVFQYRSRTFEVWEVYKLTSKEDHYCGVDNDGKKS